VKVSDLIIELQELDPDAEVILTRDSYGMSVAPIGDMRVGVFTRGCLSNAFEVHGPDFDLANEGTNTVPAVCLWPGR